MTNKYVALLDTGGFRGWDADAVTKLFAKIIPFTSTVVRGGVAPVLMPIRLFALSKLIMGELLPQIVLKYKLLVCV